MKAVLFDAGGTLFGERRTRDELYQEALAGLGHPLDLPAIARLRAELHDELPEVFEGHARYSDGWFREYVRRLLERVGCPADPEPVRAGLARHYLRADSFVIHGDVPPCLDALLERGLRLGVVSNWSAHLPVLLEDLGLVRSFEVVLASAALGRSKPDPAIFREALRRLDLRPDEVLHVGDHPQNDLAGARRAGLHALLLRRDGAASGTHGVEASAVVESLLEVPSRLAT
ncbi:MAG: HAD-IA family hydrolase [Planctomycetes bacterium]|nr:HAD-IA family hydrolase [Planctomycetota bacterium]